MMTLDKHYYESGEGTYMNAVLDQKRSYIFKVFTIMAVTLLCIGCLSGTVFADTGPKRSISITITNPPSEPYYVAILRPGTRPSDPDSYYRYVKIRDEDENIKEIFFNYDEDGFVLFSYGGGSSSIEYSEDMRKADSVNYGYMVPSTFKVIVVTKSGDVTVSDEITSQAFHAEFEYDYSKNTLKEEKQVLNFTINLAIESVVFCGITLVNEGIVLLCFGLFRKKNLLRFFIANLLTQTLLFGVNATCRFIEPLWQNYLIVWLFTEVLITVIELFIYRRRLVRKDGSVSVRRNIIYAITANFISAFIDIPIIFIAYLMK